MSHEHRKNLESSLKHARDYSSRLLMQTVSNSWQMLVTQQLFITLGILLLTVLVYFQFGYITLENSRQNLNASLSIIGIVFLIVICLNLLRSIFHLDREKVVISDTLLPNGVNADDFISKAEHQKALDNLKSEQRVKIEKVEANSLASFNNQAANHKEIISAWEISEKELKAELQKTLWLTDRAIEQLENINEYVYWRDAQFLQNIIEDKIYFLLFQIVIFNASVFEIEIDEVVGGKILFENLRLRAQKSIYQLPIIVKPNSMEGFLLRQELNSDEVIQINERVVLYNKQREHFHKEKPEGYDFHSRQWLAGKILYPPEVELKHLEFTIKGSSRFPQVKPKILHQMSDVRTSIEDFTKYF